MQNRITCKFTLHTIRCHHFKLVSTSLPGFAILVVSMVYHGGVLITFNLHRQFGALLSNVVQVAPAGSAIMGTMMSLRQICCNGGAGSVTDMLQICACAFTCNKYVLRSGLVCVIACLVQSCMLLLHQMKVQTLAPP